MEEITLTGQSISAFREFLVENEKARATVEKYVQEAEQLRLALCGAPVTKAGVLAYRERLQQQYRALTVNNKLLAANALPRSCGAERCEVKLLKVQRRAFREEQRDLTESEYRRLLSIAKGRKLRTVCAFRAQEAFAIITPFVKKYYQNYEQQKRSIGISLPEVDMDLVITAAPSEEVKRAIECAGLSSAFTVDDLSGYQQSLLENYRLDSLERFFESDSTGQQWRAEPLLIPDNVENQWYRTHHGYTPGF